MPGKPTNIVINWNEQSFAALRKAHRVAADAAFREGEGQAQIPSAKDIIEKLNLSTDDNWRTFKIDLPVGLKVMEGIEFDREYARYMIQYLLKILNLPPRRQWYLKTHLHTWERRKVEEAE